MPSFAGGQEGSALPGGELGIIARFEPFVIPAKAGIHFLLMLSSRSRGILNYAVSVFK